MGVVIVDGAALKPICACMCFMLSGDGAQTKVSIRQLLAWLINRVGQEAQTLFCGILFWLSAVLEGCPSVASASDDPFAAPSLVGVSGRALNISQAKRNKIVRIWSAGVVFKSGRAVLAGAKTLGCAIGAEHDNTANKWVWPYVLQYMHALLNAFHWQQAASSSSYLFNSLGRIKVE